MFSQRGIRVTNQQERFSDISIESQESNEHGKYSSLFYVGFFIKTNQNTKKKISKNKIILGLRAGPIFQTAFFIAQS